MRSKRARASEEYKDQELYKQEAKHASAILDTTMLTGLSGLVFDHGVSSSHGINRIVGASKFNNIIKKRDTI